MDSISDEVNEVEDTDYILTVEKTFVVLDESFTENGGSYTLNYTIKGKMTKPSPKPMPQRSPG